MREALWHAARNVLCVRLDYLGDVLMCTPAIRALKAGHPERRITLLTSPGAARAAPYLPIDAVIDYAAPWLKASAGNSGEADCAFIDYLRVQQFDAAVIFTTYSQSALPAAMLCHLAGIPLRLAHCRENPYQLLSDWVPETEPEKQVRHEVRRQLDLVAAIGCRGGDERLSFALRQADCESVAAMLAEQGIDRSSPWVLMHPGASAASRRYPARHWSALTALIARRHGWPMVLSGSVDEAPLIDDIMRDGAGIMHSMAGRLDLGQLAALIATAPVIVSNNTGPAHIAAALGTPIVDLYALTNPQHTPWQVASRVLYHDVPCRNCYKSVCPQGHHDCLDKVQPESVLMAIESLLADARRAREFAPKEDVCMSIS